MLQIVSLLFFVTTRRFQNQRTESQLALKWQDNGNFIKWRTEAPSTQWTIKLIKIGQIKAAEWQKEAWAHRSLRGWRMDKRFWGNAFPETVKYKIELVLRPIEDPYWKHEGWSQRSLELLRVDKLFWGFEAPWWQNKYKRAESLERPWAEEGVPPLLRGAEVLCHRKFKIALTVREHLWWRVGPESPRWWPEMSNVPIKKGSVRIDRLRALSWYYGRWCMTVLGWCSDLSG